MSRNLRLRNDAELAALLQKRAPAKRNKFNAERNADGDSKKEREYGLELQIRERAGQVRAIRSQVWFPITVNDELVARYRADFVFEEKVGGEWARKVIDVKGMTRGTAFELFNLKKKLLLALHGIDVQVV